MINGMPAPLWATLVAMEQLSYLVVGLLTVRWLVRWWRGM